MSSIASGIIVCMAQICEHFLNGRGPRLCYTHKKICPFAIGPSKVPHKPRKSALFCTVSTRENRPVPVMSCQFAGVYLCRKRQIARIRVRAIRERMLKHVKTAENGEIQSMKDNLTENSARGGQTSLPHSSFSSSRQYRSHTSQGWAFSRAEQAASPARSEVRYSTALRPWGQPSRAA